MAKPDLSQYIEGRNVTLNNPGIAMKFLNFKVMTFFLWEAVGISRLLSDLGLKTSARK
jgi:hypothetical protein